MHLVHVFIYIHHEKCVFKVKVNIFFFLKTSFLEFYAYLQHFLHQTAGSLYQVSVTWSLHFLTRLLFWNICWKLIDLHWQSWKCKLCLVCVHIAIKLLGVLIFPCSIKGLLIWNGNRKSFLYKLNTLHLYQISTSASPPESMLIHPGRKGKTREGDRKLLPRPSRWSSAPSVEAGRV